jgi:hypothetical protein
MTGHLAAAFPSATDFGCSCPSYRAILSQLGDDCIIFLAGNDVKSINYQSSDHAMMTIMDRTGI